MNDVASCAVCMAEALDGESAERRLRRRAAGAAGDRRRRARSRVRRRSPRRRAGSPSGWTRALAQLRGRQRPRRQRAAGRLLDRSGRRHRARQGQVGEPGRELRQLHRPRGCATSGTAAGDDGLLRERDRTASRRATRGCHTHDHASRNAAGGIARAGARVLVLGVGRAGERATDLLRGLHAAATASRPATGLYACGNCHLKWTGTGARNPFGSAVEQQLYVGKSITQALADIEPMDTDGDGFTNLDEIATYETLPGYSCDNFFLAAGRPHRLRHLHHADGAVVPRADRHPHRAASPSASSPRPGRPDTLQLADHQQRQHRSHHGQLVSGSSPGATPRSQRQRTRGAVRHPGRCRSSTLDVSLRADRGRDRDAAPCASPPTIPTSRRSTSPVQGFGFVQTLAPADKRARCLKSIDKRVPPLRRSHRREWNRCFLDEVNGLACDTGTRDLKIQQAETRFRDGHRRRQGQGLRRRQPERRRLLDLPATCGGGCNITVSTHRVLRELPRLPPERGPRRHAARRHRHGAARSAAEHRRQRRREPLREADLDAPRQGHRRRAEAPRPLRAREHHRHARRLRRRPTRAAIAGVQAQVDEARRPLHRHDRSARLPLRRRRGRPVSGLRRRAMGRPSSTRRSASRKRVHSRCLAAGSASVARVGRSTRRSSIRLRRRPGAPATRSLRSRKQGRA